MSGVFEYKEDKLLNCLGHRENSFFFAWEITLRKFLTGAIVNSDGGHWHMLIVYS